MFPPFRSDNRVEETMAGTDRNVGMMRAEMKDKGKRVAVEESPYEVGHGAYRTLSDGDRYDQLDHGDQNTLLLPQERMAPATPINNTQTCDYEFLLIDDIDDEDSDEKEEEFGEEEEEDDDDDDDEAGNPLAVSTVLKPRVRWTGELHDRFLGAVKKLGGPLKATPKGVMEMMDVSGLGLCHIKSHLQKYRLGKFTVHDLDCNHSIKLKSKGSTKTGSCPSTDASLAAVRPAVPCVHSIPNVFRIPGASLSPRAGASLSPRPGAFRIPGASLSPRPGASLSPRPGAFRIPGASLSPRPVSLSPRPGAFRIPGASLSPRPSAFWIPGPGGACLSPAAAPSQRNSKVRAKRPTKSRQKAKRPEELLLQAEAESYLTRCQEAQRQYLDLALESTRQKLEVQIQQNHPLATMNPGAQCFWPAPVGLGSMPAVNGAIIYQNQQGGSFSTCPFCPHAYTSYPAYNTMVPIEPQLGISANHPGNNFQPGSSLFAATGNNRTPKENTINPCPVPEHFTMPFGFADNHPGNHNFAPHNSVYTAAGNIVTPTENSASAPLLEPAHVPATAVQDEQQEGQAVEEDPWDIYVNWDEIEILNQGDLLDDPNPSESGPNI